MIRKEHKPLLLRAIAVWGDEPQWRQLQEECAELIAAVNRFTRRREGSEEQLIEELADVEIMLAQARLILGGLAQDAVDTAIVRKLERLQKRLDAPPHKHNPGGPVG
jgi:NTP pyrophosphatase (non-canonical NTP hydrolase)